MDFPDLIARKRDGKSLRDDDWRRVAAAAADWAAEAETAPVPAYQLSALLMAAYLRGLEYREVLALTRAVAASGERLEWPGVERPLVDKHSTGGVGDKLSLIVVPLLAACGAAVPKLSGRALGHTGGTLDKLESIPGLRLDYEPAELGRLLRDNGCFIAGHSAELAPADAALYHLRDVTATVDSPPLVVASILGKKLAAGAQTFVIDVKTGAGALFRSRRTCERLARRLVRVSRDCGRRCVCLLSSMDQPLGNAVGNAVEVEEALAVLEGRGPADVRGLALELAARGLKSAGLAASITAARESATARLDDGAAREVFARMIAAQGGDLKAFTERETAGVVSREVAAPRSGYLRRLDARRIGRLTMLLGAGRRTVADAVDPAAGVRLLAKRGERLEEGQALAVLQTSRPARLEAAARSFAGAVGIGDDKPTPRSLIHRVID